MILNTNKVDFAILLAGGKSSRMNQDKALLPIKDMSLLEYQADKLAQIADNIIISRNDDIFSHINDSKLSYGPLAGVHACLSHIKNNTMKLSADIIVMPVDMPLMSKALFDNLIQYGQIHHKACYYEDNFLPIYLPEIESPLSVLDSMLSEEQKLVNTFLENMDAEDIECIDKSRLANANTPMQWKIILKQINEIEAI